MLQLAVQLFRIRIYCDDPRLHSSGHYYQPQPTVKFTSSCKKHFMPFTVQNNSQSIQHIFNHKSCILPRLRLYFFSDTPRRRENISREATDILKHRKLTSKTTFVTRVISTAVRLYAHNSWESTSMKKLNFVYFPEKYQKN